MFLYICYLPFGNPSDMYMIRHQGIWTKRGENADSLPAIRRFSSPVLRRIISYSFIPLDMPDNWSIPKCGGKRALVTNCLKALDTLVELVNDIFT